MRKESIYELQLIDMNCNTCIHFKRDVKKTKKNNNNPLIKRNTIHYGLCKTRGVEVTAIANICSPENEGCFKHRKLNNK